MKRLSSLAFAISVAANVPVAHKENAETPDPMVIRFDLWVRPEGPAKP